MEPLLDAEVTDARGIRPRKIPCPASVKIALPDCDRCT